MRGVAIVALLSKKELFAGDTAQHGTARHGQQAVYVEHEDTVGGSRGRSRQL